MADEHSYSGEFPGWCACDHWCATEADYRAHLDRVATRAAEAAKKRPLRPESPT